MFQQFPALLLPARAMVSPAYFSDRDQSGSSRKCHQPAEYLSRRHYPATALTAATTTNPISQYHGAALQSAQSLGRWLSVAAGHLADLPSLGRRRVVAPGSITRRTTRTPRHRYYLLYPRRPVGATAPGTGKNLSLFNLYYSHIVGRLLLCLTWQLLGAHYQSYLLLSV